MRNGFMFFGNTWLCTSSSSQYMLRTSYLVASTVQCQAGFRTVQPQLPCPPQPLLYISKWPVLGYILLNAHRPYLTCLRAQSDASLPTPVSAPPPQSGFRVYWLRFLVIAPWSNFVAHFPPRLASRKSTFFLTVAVPVRTMSERYGYFTTSSLLTNGVVLEHAERAVGTRAAEGHEEARQGH